MTEPQQERSRRTQDRIVQVFEEMLCEEPFDSISVAEVARRAGVTTGAFYGRFPSKNAILAALYENEDRAFHRLVAELKEERPWRGWSLRQLVPQAIAAVVAHYREKKGILRALALFARTHPEEISPECRRLRGELHRDLCALLLEWEDEMGHPDPPVAAAFAILLLGAVCRDKVLFGDAPHASSTELDDTGIVQELTTNLLAYLGVR